MTFTFTIHSPKYGEFTVTAPASLKDLIEARSWYVLRDPTRAEGRQFYVRSDVPRPGQRRTSLFLHQFVWDLLGRPPAEQIDHKDGDPLNNGDDNLRDGTLQNSHNRQKQTSNTSGFIGVTRY